MASEPSPAAARREHYADFVRLFAELGTHDPVPDLERWCREWAPETVFLEHDGRPVGYGRAQALSRTGYVRHVAVERALRRRGLGRALMRALAEWLRERGCERWELNVRTDNEAALALYRSLGMREAFTTRVLRLPRDVAGRLAAAAPPIAVRDAPAELDEALEERFELARGLLASLRRLSGQRILLASEPGDALGVARFDPSYPGCFPFCARTLDAARALLAAALPSLAPDAPWIQLVVERDRELARDLLSHGGTLQMEIVHLSGELPEAETTSGPAEPRPAQT
jgi:GNAT superfamily N-acetyltransferase